MLLQRVDSMIPNIVPSNQDALINRQSPPRLIRDLSRGDVARYRILGDDHARGRVLLLRVHSGLEDAAAKRRLRDTVDDNRYAADLLIDADGLLAMDNYVREVRPVKSPTKSSARSCAHVRATDKNDR